MFDCFRLAYIRGIQSAIYSPMVGPSSAAPSTIASRSSGQAGDISRARGAMLLIHLGMSGSFRIDEDGSSNAHDHVVFQLSNGSIITFNDPRRFGLMDVIEAGVLNRSGG